ncbi:MAG: hypothetical protein V3U11_02330, partial [Planctomycetota bacterium]
ERNAWNKLEVALERELKRFDSSYQRKQAVKLYRSIFKKYSKTVAGRIAEARLDKMLEAN